MKNFYKTDYCSYIIPCGYDNIVTLGGTQYYGNFNTEIDPADSISIMERCSQLAPRLRTATVVREWVGLRPYRPEIRVEVEKLNNTIVSKGCGITYSGKIFSTCFCFILKACKQDYISKKLKTMIFFYIFNELLFSSDDNILFSP